MLDLLRKFWPRVRKPLFAVAAVVLAIGLMEVMPAEMAFLFAGDILTYMEIGTVLWLATAGGRLTAAWRQAQRIGQALSRRVRRVARRPRNGAARGHRRPRPVRPGDGERGDPHPAGLAWA